MGMTIDKSTEVLADYIDTYKVCGGNGYNPATNITQEACEAFEMATDTMRKYQKITKILNSASYTENGTVYSYTYDEDTRIKHIREVIKDGKIV